METIDIKYLFQIIKKYRLLIINSAVLGTLVAACMTFFFLTNVYSASTQVLVTQANENDNNTVHSSEVQANIQMVNTYSIILQNKELLKEVSKKYSQFTAKDIAQKLIVASDSNSQVIDIKIIDDDPKVAVALVNDLTEAFIEESKGLIETNKVSILSHAYIEDSFSPSGPNHKIHLIIGLLLGLFISFIIIVLKELLDSTFKTEESVEKVLDLPVLGAINLVNFNEEGNKHDKKI